MVAYNLKDVARARRMCEAKQTVRVSLFSPLPLPLLLSLSLHDRKTEHFYSPDRCRVFFFINISLLHQVLSLGFFITGRHDASSLPDV